ncbi:hypothetical protein PR048_003440 [Dryococelus australis]|uniref:Odorant receptor n=1 Tax=Dryococelus australis TaxID=614101 RepID=A0ABQ9IN24_9NEOP|nr:hypothetical protein PR048_003440 [Dryococelus australis]
MAGRTSAVNRPLIDIGVNIRLLKVFGLLGVGGSARWPHQVYSGLVVAAFTLTVVPTFAAVLRDWGKDLNTVVDNTCLALPLFFSSVRCTYFICRRRDVTRLIAELLRFQECAWPGAAAAERASIMAGTSRLSRATTVFFNFLGVLMFATISGSPVLAATRRHPFAAEYLLFDHRCSPCFEAVYAFQVACLFLIIFSIIAFDTMCMVLLMHGGAQFDVLSAALRKVRGPALVQLEQDAIPRHSDTQPRLLLDLHMRQSLVRCVQRHNDIIEFVKKLNDVYNPVMLGLIVYSMTMIALTSFRATESSSEVGDLLKYAVLSSTCIFELYLFCRLCHDILQRSQGVVVAAFYCDWCDAGVEVNGIVRMIIARANKPVRLSAGRFRIMSVETFAAVRTL